MQLKQQGPVYSCTLDGQKTMQLAHSKITHDLLCFNLSLVGGYPNPFEKQIYKIIKWRI